MSTPATIAFVVGTRPEAIKLAPVILTARRQPAQLRPVVVATGQHRDLVRPALAAFGLAADYDLDAMRTGQSLGELASECIRRLDDLFAHVRPRTVVVHGDTTSSLAGALAGFYRQVPVAHVEAGLRTGNRSSPFPEECNRQMIARLARTHFAPTHRARANLVSEGVRPSEITVTGNTIVDAVRLLRPLLGRIRPPVEFARRPRETPPTPSSPWLVLVTAHRRESFGRPLDSVCAALRELATYNPELHFVVLQHANPRAASAFQSIAGHRRITLLPPQGYLETLWLVSQSWLVLTDSGGLQEEAPTFGTPVLVLRNCTERLEGIDAGVARLVGTDRPRIVQEVCALLADPARHAAMRSAANPYGDGRAARRIVGRLIAEANDADLENAA